MAVAGESADRHGMDIQISALPAGTPAPRFSLPLSAYASVSLTDLRGQRGVLIFYPADWEPVSQQQLSLCQEHLTEFTSLRARLIGISSDHIWSHAAFTEALGIRFPLLSDVHPRGAVARMFGVFDAHADLSARALFVLDEQGSLSTIHANSPEDALSRLETMAIMAGMDLPPKAIVRQIAAAVDIVVQAERVRGGMRRIVRIAETMGLHEGEIEMRDLFAFHQTGVSADGDAIGTHTATGQPSRFLERFRVSGEDIPESIFEPAAIPGTSSSPSGTSRLTETATDT